MFDVGGLQVSVAHNTYIEECLGISKTTFVEFEELMPTRSP